MYKYRQKSMILANGWGNLNKEASPPTLPNEGKPHPDPSPKGRGGVITEKGNW